MQPGQTRSMSQRTLERVPRHRFVAASLLGALGLVVPRAVEAASDLVLIPDPWTLISLLVLFLVIIFPLNALIFRPVFATLDERSQRTTGAREKADEISREADEVLARYRTELAAARAAAEQSRRQVVEAAREEQVRITSAARSEAEQKVERGRAELNTSLEEARSEMGGHVRELADAAAQQILGRAL